MRNTSEHQEDEELGKQASEELGKQASEELGKQAERDDHSSLSEDQSPRPLIRPKLRKRDVGVSLTESKPSYSSSERSRAPRGLGSMVENDSIKRLRKRRAAKRALEVINHTKQRARDRATNSVPNVSEIDFSERPAQVAPEVTVPPLEMSIPPIELDPVEPDGISIDHWSLDEDALQVLEGIPDHDLLPPEELNPEQLRHINQPTSSSTDEDGHDSPSSSLKITTAEDFFNDLQSWSGDHRTHELESSAELLQPENSDHADEPTHSQDLHRGMVLWETPRKDLTQSSAHQMVASPIIGWALIRLLNKLKGAQTWVAEKVTEHGERGAQATLKIVWPKLLSENPMMWQFDAEIQVRALNQLRHPSIPEIYGWGENESHKLWFAAIEWVEGQSLAQHLRRNTLNIEEAVQLFIPLLKGLALCHEQGLIHRKIQPAHIILSPQGPKLISFQWVEEVEGQDIQRDQQSAYQALGQRPKFLAPEWMQQSLITDAADVYALGACLLEAIIPQAKNWLEAPPSLQASLAGALHPNPNDRSSAISFLKDLQLSGRSYLYRSTSGEGSPSEKLALHDVVQRIRGNALGWHLLRHSTETEDDFSPWGEYIEVVEAVERAQKYQPERSLDPSLAPSPYPDVRLDELESRERSLKERERDLRKREEELKWREEAIRDRETELTARDMSLQEESKRLDGVKASLDGREEAVVRQLQMLDDRRQDLEEEERSLSERAQSITEKEDEVEALKRELTDKEREREEALSLLETEIEAERVRLQEEEQLEQLEYQQQLQLEATRLLAQREEALRAAEEAKLQAEAERLHATEEANRARASYEEDLQKREEERTERQEAEGAFARVSLRSKKREAPPPDESAHREFDLDGLIFRARYCPAGSGWFGSDHEGAKVEERPRHRSQFDRGFWLMETPVTQSQWEALMEGNPSTHKGSELPIEGITWVEAALFCNALSIAFGLEEVYDFDGDPALSKHRLKVHWRYHANGFRLPTEAEWEYAAKSGLTGQRHTYTLGDDLNEVGWFTQNAHNRAHPVGLKAPNRWGLYDLCGNVWEWCHDEWRKDAYRQRVEDPSPNPVAYNPQLTPRVVRGGAWYDYPSACRIATRPGQDTNQGYGIGLRPYLPYSPTSDT